MKYLPDLILQVVGLLVMAFRLILGALSDGWVALACFLGVAGGALRLVADFGQPDVAPRREGPR